MRYGPRFGLAIGVLTLGLACSVTSAGAAGLRLGFQDYQLESRTQVDISTGLAHARSAGASEWRFVLYWRRVAPTRPSSIAQAADPSWSGYRWSTVDQMVKAIAAGGMAPLAAVDSAPDWAQGADPPPVSPTFRKGAWKPSAKWFGAFAKALAKRYSGTFPDPQAPGTTLPRIAAWEPWNEPNLSIEISPQWTKTRRGWSPASPEIYRGLLNAFYKGVKAVDSRSTVIAGATAPYGDLTDGSARMPPARFWRELLCVRPGRAAKATRCSRPVSFDAISHHPYPIGPPDRKARNSDDVVVPDLGKITRMIAPAVRAGSVRPATRNKPLWITEISWDSKPDPEGLSLSLQAKYLEGALYTLWKQGADVVTWFNLRDQAPDPSYASTYQSGVFFRGATPAQDTPKPSYTAFRFPFTAYRSKGVARLWGMVPQTGVKATVIIEARQGSKWVQAVRLRSGTNRIFTGRLTVGRGTQLRARVGDDISLTWKTS